MPLTLVSSRHVARRSFRPTAVQVLATLAIVMGGPTLAADGPTLTDGDGPAAAIAMKGDAAYGAYLAGECTACHGGRTAAAIPALDRLGREDFIRALYDYRTGERDHPIMGAVARSLGAAEIAALAAHYAETGR